MARYGCQDIYRLLGRDPVAHPLTLKEETLFQSALAEHLTKEFSTPEKPTPEPDPEE